MEDLLYGKHTLSSGDMKIEKRYRHGPIVCIPPLPICALKLYHPPSLSEIVFGGGIFGRYLGLNEVMSVGPHDGISVLIGEGRETRHFSLLQHKEEAM